MVDLRHGVKAFSNANIQVQAHADSRYSHIIEIIHLFRKTLKDEYWDGTCSELLVVLATNDNNRVLLKDLNSKNLGWGLKHMLSKGFSFIERSAKEQYGWKILGDVQ